MALGRAAGSRLPRRDLVAGVPVEESQAYATELVATCTNLGFPDVAGKSAASDGAGDAPPGNTPVEDPVHDEAPRWIETREPPEVLASELTEVRPGKPFEGFVPTNQLAKKGGSNLYPARTNGPSKRAWARCHPGKSTIVHRR